ncbi:ABC transporter ATP-binding protein [Actinocorallia longicatena]|uniref:ABC transporter domain-containing protein n=1 Tax=Actinocorallia longicatena TaxID=111803 RepID=A0ABP6QQ73_9ACTN
MTSQTTSGSTSSQRPGAGAGPDLPLVEALDAVKKFGDFTAVDHVSLDVKPGEIVGLLGANGAGKTTLIKMLLGLSVPTSGAVAMFGQAPSRDTRRDLGYVPQGLGLWEDMTVKENTDFAAASFGKGKPLPASLEPSANRLVGEIGLGLQRQLAFHIALSHEPRILILDEPTSGVDPLSRARLWDAVHEQAESGTGVLVTTHYMQEAQQCDRLVLMSAGKKVTAGTEADIIGDTTACEVDTTDWAAAFDALDAAGLPVTLAGRTVRLADTPPQPIHQALDAAGITATIRQVPATLEEKMTSIDRAIRH